MKIKICGIRRIEDVNLANQYNPDYIGFIFYPPSPRFLAFEKAQELQKELNDRIKTVGVFVDENPEVIIREYENGTFHIAQLHGNEDQDYIDQLKEKNIPVIKAIKIRDKDSFDQIDHLEPDYFLFDIYDKKKVGGTGEKFNWELLKGYDREIPFFLAGGINTENIELAFSHGPDILDISSGVETNFIKDKEKFKNLFKKFRELNGK